MGINKNGRLIKNYDFNKIVKNDTYFDAYFDDTNRISFTKFLYFDNNTYESSSTVIYPTILGDSESVLDQRDFSKLYRNNIVDCFPISLDNLKDRKVFFILNLSDYKNYSKAFGPLQNIMGAYYYQPRIEITFSAGVGVRFFYKIFRNDEPSTSSYGMDVDDSFSEGRWENNTCYPYPASNQERTIRADSKVVIAMQRNGSAYSKSTYAYMKVFIDQKRVYIINNGSIWCSTNFPNTPGSLLT